MPEDEPMDIFTILSGIKTFEDFNKSEKMILETALGEFKANLEAVKDLAKSTPTTPETLMKFEQIKVDQSALKNSLDEEFYRIRQIPGAGDVVLSLQGELTVRLGAIMSEMMMIFTQMINSMSGVSIGEPSKKKKYERTVLTNYTLPEGESMEALDLLRSIRSQESLKTKKAEFVNLIHEMYKANLSKATEFKNHYSDSEEVQAQAKEFTKLIVYISTEMFNEFNRLEALFGTPDPVNELNKELRANTQSMAEEIMQIIEGLGLHKVVDSEMEMDTEDMIVGEERVELEELAEVYKISSIEEFKEQEDNIVKTIQSSVEKDLQMLKDIKNGDFPADQAAAKVEEINSHMQLLENEMHKEIERIEKLPGGMEYIETWYENVQTQLGSIVEEIYTHLEEL